MKLTCSNPVVDRKRLDSIKWGTWILNQYDVLCVIKHDGNMVTCFNPQTGSLGNYYGEILVQPVTVDEIIYSRV